MSDIYRALGDVTRRRILHMLKAGAKTQKEIVEEFNMTQPAVKKHLTILLEEKIIQESRQGKYRFYQLDSKRLHHAYQELLHDIEDILEHKLKSLKDYVEE